MCSAPVDVPASIVPPFSSVPAPVPAPIVSSVSSNVNVSVNVVVPFSVPVVPVSVPEVPVPVSPASSAGSKSRSIGSCEVTRKLIDDVMTPREIVILVILTLLRVPMTLFGWPFQS